MSDPLQDVAVSRLERVIINWATPVEAALAALFRLKKHASPEHRAHFRELGYWSGECRIKLNAYRRLVQAAERGAELHTKSRELGVFRRTPCGYAMILTYDHVRPKVAKDSSSP